MKSTLYLLFISLCAHTCLLGNDGTAVHANFEHARQQLADMLNSKTPLSYERAVFITENAYWNNELSEAEFTNVLNLHTAYIQQLYRANHQKSIGDFNSTLLKTAAQQLQQYEQALANYAIYLYMTDTTYYIDSAHISYHLPNTYSQTDPLGTLNFSNTQVHSLLYSPMQQGNCYAQATLFKIYADRLQSNAALCTAPGHIYISHTDADGVQYNIEPATGSFPGAGTLATLTYSTTEAIKNNISMRQLDTKQAVALCLVYLAKGYAHKTGTKASAFALSCAELALQHDSLCLNGMLLKTEALEAQLMAQNKTVAQLQGDATFTAYQNLLRTMYAKGYRQMPAAQKQLILGKIRGQDVIWAKGNINPGGYETHKASLSGGVLDEEMQTKPLEIYGNTVFNTKTLAVIGFATANDTEYPIDLVTFALSVDPLAAKYPSMSPYMAFADNPILYLDVDGRYFDFSKLSKQDYESITAFIDAKRAEDAYFDVIYTQLDCSNRPYQMVVNTKLKTPGEFKLNTDHVGGKISFQSKEATSSYEAIQEEFFHAYQYEFYGYDKMYTEISSSNIEFEPRFLRQYQEINEGWLMSTMPGEEKIADLVITIDQKQTELNLDQKKSYFGALEDFRSHWQQINKETGIDNGYDDPSTNHTPDAAFDVINKVNNSSKKD